ncbi:hypothetical protein ACFWVF_30890 [Streptomyces sp. NPDC058659]|uniref:hypothetical protein n=1 Tax=unclassified Streptomyces TaxID=2593676 RepID=UPI00364B8A92
MAAEALSPDTGERITASTRPPTDTGVGVRAAAGNAAEDFGSEHVRGRVERG